MNARTSPPRAAILGFLHRLSRTDYAHQSDAFVAEAMHNGGGVLWPGTERHAGRALVELHGLTATGVTLAAAQRNWRKMALSTLNHPDHPTPPPMAQSLEARQ